MEACFHDSMDVLGLCIVCPATSLVLITRGWHRYYSTGGIIALGLGVEGWSIDKCIDHFENLCTKAFTPREFHGIPGLEQLSAINHNYSKYKSKPFEGVLKASFSASDQPLFGGKQDHCHSSVKVAVTSTTATDVKALLLTNYNRSHKRDHQGKYLYIKLQFNTKIVGSQLHIWASRNAWKWTHRMGSVSALYE